MAMMRKKHRYGLDGLSSSSSVLPFLQRFALVCLADGEGDGEGDGGGDPGDKGGGDGGKDGGDSGDKGGGKKGAGAIAAMGGEDGNGPADAGKFGDFDLGMLPENLRGATAEETLAKMYPSWKGLRDAQAQQGKPPEKADDYPVPDLAEDVKGFYPDLQNDDVFKIARNAAHKIGLPGDKFKAFIGETLTALGKSGMLQPAVDPKAEYEKLGGNAEAARTAKSVEDFIDRQRAKKGQQGAMPEELIDELDLISGTANGIKLVKYFMGRIGEQGVDLPGDGGDGGAWTADKVRQAMRDPKYSSDSPKYDPAFRKQVDDANRRLSA